MTTTPSTEPIAGRKLRLMLITHDLAIGGLQQVIVNICSTIDRERFDVSVLCLRGLGEFASKIEALGMKVFMIPQNGRTDYLSFLKVAKVLRKEKVDIIHTHNTQPFVDGTIAALLAGVKTIIHTDHARPFPDKRRYMIAEWVMSHFACKIIGVSEHTSNNLNKYEKIPAGKIATIPNGIDGSVFNVEIDRNEKKNSLGIPQSHSVLGIVSRIIKEKGISNLLKAMSRVLKKNPDVTLLVVGDGAYRNVLEKQASDLKISNNVCFLGARMDIPELLSLMDIFILPSLSEGLPMVLIEAMAARCPVIATRVGGIPMALGNGHDGILIEAGSVGGIEKAVLEMLSDRTLRQRYANRAFSSFQQRFSAGRMTTAYSKLYSSALSR